MDDLNGFDALIAAFGIFKKYAQPAYPTGCEHDELYVYVDSDLVRADDIAALSTLGFVAARGAGGFISYRFGSA